MKKKKNKEIGMKCKKNKCKHYIDNCFCSIFNEITDHMSCYGGFEPMELNIMTEKRFENRLNQSKIKFNTLNPVWDNEKKDALNIFEIIDLLNQLYDENEQLKQLMALHFTKKKMGM